MLPTHQLCTGCMACVDACPKKCISVEKDDAGALYPKIKAEECVDCGRCQSVCHLNKDNLWRSQASEEVYAGWSTDDTVRKQSASGGIATAIYKYALENRIHIYGCRFEVGKGAYYFEIKDDGDISKSQNSKYVCSEMGHIYSSIKHQLDKKESVLFIGLPCHVAALLSYLGGRNDKLVTIDILCHGVAPVQYLSEHIAAVEEKINNRVDEISFRDPQFETKNYMMTFRNCDNIVYKSPVDEADVYQIGYHKGLIYRENCYCCRYARKERVGDITLSDFSGLGKIKAWGTSKAAVSCIVVSTEKGAALIRALVEKKKIYITPRPFDEAYKYDRMFNAPTVPHKKRGVFINEYKNGKGFESSAKAATKFDVFENRINSVIPLKRIKNKFKRISEKLFKEGMK